MPIRPAESSRKTVKRAGSLLPIISSHVSLVRIFAQPELAIGNLPRIEFKDSCGRKYDIVPAQVFGRNRMA